MTWTAPRGWTSEPAAASSMTVAITGHSDTDISLAGQVVTCTPTNASGTVTYAWTATSPTLSTANTAVFSSATAQAPTFTPSGAGAWRLTCTATDSVGAVTVTVTVRCGYLLAQIPWIPVDLVNGSWTFSDPDALLANAPTIANAIHTFTVATKSADEKWSITAASNFTGPRWSTPLVDDAGTALTSNDHFQIHMEIDEQGTGNSGPIAFFAGTCESPTSTVLATMMCGGCRVGRTAIGANPTIGSFSATAVVEVAANVANRIAMVYAHHRPGGQPDYQVTVLNGTGDHRDTVTRADGYTYTPGAALHMIFGVALWSAASVSVSGQEAKIRARYKVLRMTPAPTVS